MLFKVDKITRVKGFEGSKEENHRRHCMKVHKGFEFQHSTKNSLEIGIKTTAKVLKLR
jgi:hypothetical protein